MVLVMNSGSTQQPVTATVGEIDALETLINNLPFGAGLVSMEGRLLAHNLEFGRIYGMDHTPPPGAGADQFGPSDLTIWEILDLGHFDHLFDDARKVFEDTFAALARGEEFRKNIEVQGRLIEILDRPIGNGLIVTTHADITDRKRAEQQVEYLAWHDPLTGLPNRAAFSNRLNNVMEEARILGTSFCVISVDLDRFKDVNDVFGHGSGDALLKEIGRRFANFAKDCFVARLGGDEFVFLCDYHAGIGEMAETLLQEAGTEVEINGNRILVNLSAGIAVYPENGADVEALLNASDAALYRAKEEGRATYRFFEPEMDKRIHNRRRLAQDLRVALSRGELSLHYQPQSTVDGEITGFEALLRWQHPEHGAISPVEFIPVAEESGLIVDIGAWALKTACAEATQWDEKYAIAVNLSPLQFRHGDLPALLSEILLETDLDPNRLEIEITEGVLVHDFPRALDILNRIKQMGVRIAMDDFGTGYSSLSYLQSFPFDKLKIDRSFIGRIGEDQHAREIVRAVIGLGRGLNMPIVAEGVETREQLDFLTAEKCFGIQGFLLGRPEVRANTLAKFENDEDASDKARQRTGNT